MNEGIFFSNSNTFATLVSLQKRKAVELSKNGKSDSNFVLLNEAFTNLLP